MSFFDYFGFDVAAPSKPGFKARTFEEYAAPLKIYAAAYKEAEEDYSDLIAQTEMWKDKARQEDNPDAYKLYKQYADRLQKWSDEFSTGMNLTNKAQLMGLKRDYYKNIQPISDAYEIVKKKAEERSKLGPDAVWHRSDIKIDDFLHGNLGMEDDEYLSKKDVETYAGEYIEKMMLENPSALNVFNDKYNNLWKTTPGASGTKDDYLELFNGAFGEGAFASAFRDMQKILKVEEFDTKGRDQINQAIMKGFLKGIGAPSYEYLGFDKNKEHEWDMEKLKKAQEYDMEKLDAKAADAGSTGSTESTESGSGFNKGSLLPGKGIIIRGNKYNARVEELPQDLDSEEFRKEWNSLSSGVVDVNEVIDLGEKYEAFVDKLNAVNPETGMYIEWEDTEAEDGNGRPKSFGQQNARTMSPKVMEDILAEYAEKYPDSNIVKAYLGIIAQAARMIESASTKGNIKNLNITASLRALMNDPNRRTGRFKGLVEYNGSMPYLEQLFNAARNASLLLQYGNQLPPTVQVGLSHDVGKNTVTFRVDNPKSAPFYDTKVSSSGVSIDPTNGI